MYKKGFPLENSLLDGANALQIINDLSELVYLVDPKNYDLLYINRACAERFQIEDYRGKKCYQLLYEKTEPCQSCNNDQLTHRDCLCWNCYNPVVKRYYQLKDKLIDLDENAIKLEIACDVTELENQRRTLESNLKAATFVNDCARELSNLEEPEQALLRTLQNLGNFLRSDHVYISEIVAERKKNIYEWYASGMEQKKSVKQDVRINLFNHCRDALKENECVLISDLEDLKAECPEEYKELSRQGIHSLIICPLMEGKRLIGYIGADNYLAEVESDLLWLLSSLGHFVSAMLQHIILLDMDLLTQTYNHNRFIRDLEKKISFPVGIVYVDINGMKEINDTYGHAYGDEVLANVSKKIKEIFPESNRYRIGGDEFVVTVPGVEEVSFDMKVQALKGAFDHTSSIKASIGSKWSPSPIDLPELVRAADEQMYKAKKSFYRGNKESKRYRGPLDQIRELSNPTNLDQQLKNDRFLIYYQPKFHTGTECLAGAEALIRYLDESGTLYSPAKFVPYLEEKGLISALDYYVFEQVCRNTSEWVERGFQPVPVAVNFSRFTLEKEGFVRKILALCRQFETPKEFIEIEVTETTEAQNTEVFYQSLAQLRENGFRIAIDDFGAKHANLNLLVDTDFDILKIDMHVIRNLNARVKVVDRMEKSEKCRRLIETVTKFCNRTGIQTVAEGVEDAEQLDFLKQTGCMEVQGFLFSKPIPAQRFVEEYLRPNGKSHTAGKPGP